MEVIQKSTSSYLFRFDRGDDLLDSLQSFCAQHSMVSGWFQALGSSQELELGYFNLSEKKYETQSYREVLEIVSLSGNLSKKDDILFCHAHGVFSRPNMTTIAGHIVRCTIGATCELLFMIGERNVHRTYNPEVGLHLLESENE